ncbi:MAG TPA: SMC family ATPase [candidate division Zixibacteria bacterium]
MQLRSISLENYRRFKSAEMEFPDGIVGIIGNNGAGKSTLMEAIAWALFGTDASRTSKDQIKSIFARRSDPCRVILDFEMNGDNYQVVRELKGASHTMDASVFVNKKPAARGNNPVNDLIETTLDMDYQAFMTSFYAKQRELNALSDYQPYKRKELLARMLGIENVDAGLKSLRADKRELELKLDFNRTHLKDRNELDLQKKEKSESHAVLEKKVSHTQEELESTASDFKMTEEQWTNLKAKYEESVRLNQQKHIKQAEKRSLEEQLKTQEKERTSLELFETELKKIETLLTSYEEIKKRLSALDEQKIKDEHRKITQNQIREIEVSISSDTKRLEFLNKKLETKAEVERNLKELKEKLVLSEKELEEERNLYTNLESSLKSLKDEEERLQSQMEQIEKLGPDSVCDRCLRPMGSDYQKIRQHLTGELNQLEEKVQTLAQKKEKVAEKGKELKNKKTEWETSRDQLQKSVEALSRWEGEKANLENNLREKQKNLSSLEDVLRTTGEVEYDPAMHQKLKTEFENLEKLKQKSTELSSEIKRLPLVKKRMEEIQMKDQNLKQEGVQIDKAILNLGFSEEKYKTIEKELEDKREKVHVFELAIKDVGYQTEMLKKEIDQIELEIKNAGELSQRIKGWEEEQRYLEKLDLLFSDFKVSLIGRIRPALERYTKELFLELCENRYENLELNEDYEIYIYDQGEKFPLSRYSGGENDLANLCLRIAISILISESSQADFSFIILDEIFGSQDMLRKENILTALAQLKNRFRQIFLITHIEDIKDSVENLVYITENDDGTSELKLQ